MTLGEVFERDGQRYIVTSVHRDGYTLATRIPDGDDAIGLGRRYHAVRTPEDITAHGLEFFVYPSVKAIQ